MPSITIRNIGPISNVNNIDIRPLTLVIGEQSTGKSTLMKIVCFCTWVEKHIMIEGDSFIEEYSNDCRFQRELMRFHRLNEVFLHQTQR